MTGRAGERAVTATFFALGLGLLAGFGILVRIRIHLGSALPSSDGLLWLATGLLQDALVGSLVATLLLALHRLGVPAILVRLGFGTFILATAIAHLIQSEAVILFGSTLHPEDFRAGPVLTTIQRSIRGYSGALLIATAVLVGAGLLVAGVVARRRGTASALEPAASDLAAPAGWAWMVPAEIRFLALAILSLGGLMLPIEVHRHETAMSPASVLAYLARGSQTKGSSGEIPERPSMPLVQVRELAGERPERVYVSDEYPLAYVPAPRPSSAPTLPSNVRPNFVFFAIENLRSNEVGAYGGDIPGITPNLDRLAGEGIRIDRAWSTGTVTPVGEVALWYGLPPLHGDLLLTNRPETPLTGLAEILRESGWRSFLWISSTDQTFYLRDRFYGPRGFQMFDGTHFPAEDPRVNWGVSDRVLARRAAEAIGRLHEPFAAMVLTVNNHHPYQLPSDAGPRLEGLPEERMGWSALPGSDQLLGRHTSQMLQTIHYSDQALGDFMTAAAAEPWFQRTIFVITGDHGIPVAPLGERVETIPQLVRLRHEVPLVLYSPLLAGGGVIEGPASHADVMPTLIGLAGIETRLTGIGADLLAGEGTAERPVFAWSEHERMLSIATRTWTYHCVIPVEGIPPGGPLPDEILIEVRSDPEGRVNRIGEAPAVEARFRRLARTWVDLFPWVVLSGRSGWPPEGVAGSERG